MTRLPGYSYRGAEPDAYMSSAELIGFLEGYAGFIGAPVREGVEVRRVGPNCDGLEVVTDDERWSCDAVVIASGCVERAAPPGMRERDRRQRPPDRGTRVPQPRRSSIPGRCSSSARPRRACRSPTSSSAAAGR